MSLVLSEDQVMLQDAAKNFCSQHAPISVLRRLRDENDELGFDQAVWNQMVELGWTGMAISEEFGGFDFGFGGLGVVLEQTGRTLVSSPLISTVLLGGTAIDKLGTAEQKSALLPKVVAGELLLAFAIDEKPVHNPFAIRCAATKEGNGYKLNGQKTFVLDGNIADKIVVVARTSGSVTDKEGLSVFLVDSKQAGVTIQKTNMVDSRNCANIEFANVELSADSLLGEGEVAAADLEYVLDIARIGLSAEMLGSALEVFAMILDYLKQREQFGVLIGSFQALQHRAAEMYSELELCRSAVRAALAALDSLANSSANSPESDKATIARLASLTKAKLCEVTELVSNEGVQMHGGIGMTDEFDIGFYLKRARVAQQYLGDVNYHRDRYASLQGF